MFEALQREHPDAVTGTELPGNRPAVTAYIAGNSSAMAAEQVRARVTRSAGSGGRPAGLGCRGGVRHRAAPVARTAPCSAVTRRV